MTKKEEEGYLKRKIDEYMEEAVNCTSESVMYHYWINKADYYAKQLNHLNNRNTYGK